VGIPSSTYSSSYQGEENDYKRVSEISKYICLDRVPLRGDKVQLEEIYIPILILILILNIRILV
jgi:hypothetical protein